jgi:hypothetical protein
LSRSHLSRTKEASATQKIPRDSDLCFCTWLRDPVLQQKILPALPLLRGYRSWRSSVPGTRDEDKIPFLISNHNITVTKSTHFSNAHRMFTKISHMLVYFKKPQKI